MFRLSGESIDCDALREQMRDVRAGALCTFEGRVRDHNEGQAVTLLEYEAYGALAVKEGERIVAEAREKFGVYDVVCVHRTGALQLGDIAVWVGATAKHRDAAFAATRFVIDEVKKRVPVWKKEHYVGGATEWVNCAHDHGEAHGKPESDKVFARQMILPQIADRGQQKLRDARVLIVGAGGLGCPAALYLAAAGVGTIGVCDGDRVELSNLHRQVLFGVDDVGHPKANIAVRKLAAQYPLTRFAAHDALFKPELLRDYDVVLDCTDNFEAKFEISDACREGGKTVIQASVYQFEGQLTASFSDGDGQCLRCLWTDPPESGCVGNCAETGIVGATVGTFGSLQAMEAIKFICGMNSDLRTHVVFFDLLSLSTRRVKAKIDPRCIVHGTPVAAAPSEKRGAAVMQEPVEWKLDPLEMSRQEFKSFELIDIREPDEDPSGLIASLLSRAVRSVPLSTIDIENPGLDTSKQYLFICARGGRSDNLVAKLRERGYANTFSLSGGLQALRRKFIA
jgi:adenylyltransferase/sulfurtransferase